VQKLADVRERMASVTGIGEVCRTLATVASAKLAQTHARARAARDYAGHIRTILARQQAALAAAHIEPAELSPFLVEPERVATIELLVVGADRGLCGGYNLALGREARRFASGRAAEGVEVSAIVKGRRAETYLRRATDVPIADASAWTRAGVSVEEVDALLERISTDYTTGVADEVWATYTSFVSTMRREPVTVRLLPIRLGDTTEPADAPVDGANTRWFYEPALAPCVSELLRAFVRLQVEDVLLEAFASEQAARMVTMQEASERADRSLVDLRVHYNRLRRESITADLVGVLVAGRMRAEAKNRGAHT
jgi:F-type H+-transporting ATPase subunit gamma